MKGGVWLSAAAFELSTGRLFQAHNLAIDFFAPSSPSATCLHSSLGCSFTFRLAAPGCKAKELVNVRQLWKQGCADRVGIQQRTKRPLGPYPPKSISLPPSFANYWELNRNEHTAESREHSSTDVVSLQLLAHR